MNQKRDYIAQSDDTNFEKKVRDLLLYRRVVRVEQVDDQKAKLILDNGTELFTEGSKGCGGCEYGWYYLQELNSCENVITNVECTNVEEQEYHIFVFAENKKIDLVEYQGADNGYYGTGYHLYAVIQK